MKRRRLWPLAIVVILVVAAGVYFFRAGDKPQPVPPPKGSAAIPAVSPEALGRIPVKTWKVVRRDVEVTLPVFGAINYLEKFDVAADFTGILKEVLVKPGDLVIAGQALAIQDTEVLQAELAAKQALAAQAQSQARLAAWEYEANQKLYRAGAVAKKDLEEAQAAHFARQAEVERFRAEAAMVATQIKKSTIRAPRAAMVGQKNFSPGERVPPNSEKGVVTLMRVDEVYAEAELSEKDLPRLRAGLEAAVIPDAYPQTRLRGQIERLEPVLKEQSRTAIAKVRLPNPDRRLKPGMFARVEIILDKAPQVVAVPAQALRLAPDKSPYIFVIADEVAFLRKIVPGLTTENWVEVKQGLEPGEAVVVEGGERLKELARVASSPATF